MLQEAERNGDDLTEEERERRKAEKRRLKKKVNFLFPLCIYITDRNV